MQPPFRSGLSCASHAFSDLNPLMNRRTFLNRSGRSLAGVGAVTAAPSWLHAASVSKRPELRITRILIQEARGRRLTPVAPNAYAAYRGYEGGEPVLRIQTAQNVEGICRCPVRAEKLKPLLGLDAVKLFSWDGDRVRGVAEKHKTL